MNQLAKMSNTNSWPFFWTIVFFLALDWMKSGVPFFGPAIYREEKKKQTKDTKVGMETQLEVCNTPINLAKL